MRLGVHRVGKSRVGRRGAGSEVKSEQSSTALYITWDKWPGGDTAPVPRSWPGQGAATPGDGTFKLSGMCRFRNR